AWSVLSSDPVQMRGASDEDRSVRDADRGERCAVDFIRRNLAKRLPWFDDRRYAVLAQEVEAAVGEDRGSGIISAEALLPVGLPRSRIHTIQDSRVVHDVQLVAEQQRRRRERRASLERPRHVRLRHVTSSIRTNGEKGWLVEPTGDEDQAVTIDRPN